MPDTPFPPGEPISPRDGEIRWFEPVIAAPRPAPAALDGDSAANAAPAARRAAIPWREVRWVGFASEAERAAPPPALAPPTLPSLSPSAEVPRAAPQLPPIPPADSDPNPGRVSLPSIDTEHPGAAARLRRRLRAGIGGLLRFGAATASVSVLAIFAYHNGERLADAMPRPPAAAMRAGPMLDLEGGAASAASTAAAEQAARFHAGAEAGEATAQFNLAVLYLRGDGVVQDPLSAASWFRKAAVNGSPAAQFNLAVMFERGLGVRRDLDEAIRWYRRAAEHGYPAAQYNLAIAYAEGRGAPQDWASAARWYRQAALNGLVPAMVNFAILCEKGDGIEASLPEAYAWYRAAARRGDAGSAQRAGELFDQFTGTEKGAGVLRAAAIAAALHEPGAEPPPTAATAAAQSPEPAPILKAGAWKNLVRN